MADVVNGDPDVEHEQEPVPPRWALKCPHPHGHVRIIVRDEWFYCKGCNEQYGEVIERRSGERIPHAEFVERFGTPRYERRI
jgi:hypothetical protein